MDRLPLIHTASLMFDNIHIYSFKMFIKDKKDIHNVFNQNYIFQKVYLHSYIYRKCLNMSGVS